MKRFTTLLLTLCLLLCACHNGGRVPMDSGEDEVRTEPPTPTVTEKEDETAYLNIERTPAKGYESKYYAFQKDETLLRITHPSEWILLPMDGIYYIMHDNVVIGELIGDYASDADRWTAKQIKDFAVDGGSVIMLLESKKASAGATLYRYRYVYEYVSNLQIRVVTMTVECAAVDAVTEKKLLSDTRFLPNSYSTTLGMLSHLPTPRSILILGNSFVNSSNIGSILTELLKNNGKDIEVTAISRGMASVMTYANDSNLIASLEIGAYDMVFLCGFYSSEAVEKLSVFVNACATSGTALVIFPAHNESVGVINYAKSQYKSINVLNWKAELDRLISTGVSRWDLCVDDTYDHSKPLAGYVGAHLIYRAIYGVSPQEPMKSSISQTEIDRILGNYSENGDSQRFDPNLITYFP